jgi:hypothetical protein
MLGTDHEIESKTRYRAYAIWEAEGRPDGRAMDHWLAAEREFRPAIGSPVVEATARATKPRRRTSNGIPAEGSSRPASTARRKKAAAAAGEQT